MRATLLLFLLVLPSRATFRSEDAGTAGGQFLKLGADARAAAMGQAARAACSDASAAYWNPAALATVGSASVSLTHGSYYQSVFYDFMAYSQPVDTLLGTKSKKGRPSPLGTIGVAALYLNAGKLNEIDNAGTPTGGAFTPQDLAGIFAWGMTLVETLDVGVGFKYVSSRIEREAKTGAVDLGARLRLRLLDRPYAAAVTATNLGGHLRFASQSDPLPLQIAFSQSLAVTPRWTVAADLVGARDSGVYPSLGTEYVVALREDQSAALRLGYDGRASAGELSGLTGLSAGGGIGIGRFAFDYAWVPYGLLGYTHRLTVSFRL